MIDLRSLGVITTLAFLPLPALAHHGVSGQFDTSQTFEVTGTITRIRLVNPHAYVYFDVTDDSGEVTNMRCELSSGSLLKRRGWTADMFEIGSQITIQGSPTALIRPPVSPVRLPLPTASSPGDKAALTKTATSNPRTGSASARTAR